jgi:chromate transport protein ChrA
MHRLLVERAAVDRAKARFMHALNYCMLLPGPEAQQLATYVGWLLHRKSSGGLAAGESLFRAAGLRCCMLGLSFVLYAAFQGALPGFAGAVRRDQGGGSGDRGRPRCWRIGRTNR